MIFCVDISQREFLQKEVERLIKQRISEPECERKEEWSALANEFKKSDIKTIKTLNRLGYTPLMLVLFDLLGIFLVKIAFFFAGACGVGVRTSGDFYSAALSFLADLNYFINCNIDNILVDCSLSF
jgi:hypothetical protein